jgi:hypothetical protein
MRKNLLLFSVMLSALLLGGVAMPNTVQAAVAPGCSSTFLGLPAWYKYLDVGQRTLTVDGVVIVTDECALIGPTKDGTSDFDALGALPLIGLAIVEILSRIAALVAVGFVMYGGFRYIMSQGEPENTKSARQMIINSLIGLMISIIAISLVAFIASQLA